MKKLPEKPGIRFGDLDPNGAKRTIIMGLFGLGALFVIMLCGMIFNVPDRAVNWTVAGVLGGTFGSYPGVLYQSRRMALVGLLLGAGAFLFFKSLDG